MADPRKLPYTAALERFDPSAEPYCNMHPARLEEYGLTEVPVLIRDGDETVVDESIPWAKVLEIDATGHLARHLRQLRALRPAE